MITWDDLRGQRVAVWGLGREGQATVRRLERLAADIVPVEDAPGDPGSVYPTASGILTTVDAVIKSPGISRYRPEVTDLTGRGIPVLGGLGLWLASRADTDRIVCITGTKGKSTTTALLAHLLNGLGYPASTGGNIGAVPWDPGAATTDYYVIEVSSYQATDLPCAPKTVAVTSLHPDHLDWHGGVQQYYRDKLSLCTKPGAELTVANGDSDLIREHKDLLGPHIDWVTAAEAAPWMLDTLPGEHNKRNALIAAHCIAALGIHASPADLAGAIRGYEGLPSRLKTIGTVGGVTFVDDSLSTNVLPTIAALDAFPARRIALIAGGHDRGIDYAPLAAAIAARAAPVMVFTLPGSGDRIHSALASENVAARKAPDLPAAVREAHDWAQPDGLVLLSPASPSFGQFRDYRDRAEAFARAMRALSAGSAGGPNSSSAKDACS